MRKASPLNQAWQLAYAKQAKSDWRIRTILIDSRKADKCQILHYLQMACEKLCKAHLIGAGALPEDARKSHRAAGKSLLSIVRQQLSGESFQHITGARKSLVIVKAQKIAREVELLSPAVDDAGRRPDNCEYPWQDASGTVMSPVDFNFPHLEFLDQQTGRTLLKILDQAISELPS